jgi:hypothetical protein
MSSPRKSIDDGNYPISYTKRLSISPSTRSQVTRSQGARSEGARSEVARSQVDAFNDNLLREQTKFDLRTPGLRSGYIINHATKGPVTPIYGNYMANPGNAANAATVNSGGYVNTTSIRMNQDEIQQYRQSHIINRNNYDQNIFKYEMDRLNNM